MQLKEIKTITSSILLLSGLHIGAGKDTVEIGGLDQPIIKNPFTQAPYIPGSSLKGKMRSLLEIAFMKDYPEMSNSIMSSKDHHPCDCGKISCPVCVLFGPHKAADECEANLGPTRLLVRDSFLCTKDMALFENGQLPMEIKYENTINRVTGTAEHPRPLERVPAGVRFNLNLALRIFEAGEGEDEKGFTGQELQEWVLKGLKLVEMDALGGGGSRGSGEVRFENLKLNNEKWRDNLDDVRVF